MMHGPEGRPRLFAVGPGSGVGPGHRLAVLPSGSNRRRGTLYTDGAARRGLQIPCVGAKNVGVSAVLRLDRPSPRPAEAPHDP
jgi:hypothetical protein